MTVAGSEAERPDEGLDAGRIGLHAAPDDDDKLEATYYLALQDRTEEALSFEALRNAGRKVRRPDAAFATPDHYVPTLGRECATEAEAIIEAFREKVNLYKVTEFQTRADIGRSGEPILRKETLKKNNPAS